MEKTQKVDFHRQKSDEKPALQRKVVNQIEKKIISLKTSKIVILP